MFIELTEALACPHCLEARGAGPTQGLVAVVDRLRGRHIHHGYLGCPACERRYPVRAGVVDFESSESPAARRPHPDPAPPADGARRTDGRPDGSRVMGGASERERAIELAALLGLTSEVAGSLVLDVGLAPAAEALSKMAPGLELLGFVDSMPAEAAGGEEPAGAVAGGARREEPTPAPDSAVSYARVSISSPLPIASGRLRGVALEDPWPERVREAVRALGPGGRLVVLRPRPQARELAEGLPLRVLAAEERALVAVRT